MALFGFSDISFNKGVTDRKGPLAALTSSEFTTTTLRYPIDLGNYDKGHYMVFYIRQQKNSSFKSATVADTAIDSPGGVTTSSIPNIGAAASNLGSELLGKLNSGLSQLNSATGGALSGLTGQISKAASGAIGGIVGGINNLFGQAGAALGGSGAATSALIDNSIKKISNKSFIQTTELTTDAIALYMPDTLMFNYQQTYDQANPGNELIGQLAAAGVSAAQKFKESGAGDASASLAKSALGIGADAAKGLLGKDTGDVAFAAAGVAKNPMLELIYKSPNFRTFQFDFMFYPRDEKEAFEVQKIIERFRFHQAPEIIQDAQGFLVPPSQFDIRFYYGGAQNPNIPQIATCVLTTIDVNYAPNGWSAYEVPGENKPAIGRTGMPTSIQMTLQFQEVTYLTKTDFKTGKEQGIVKNVFDPSNLERDV